MAIEELPDGIDFTAIGKTDTEMLVDLVETMVEHVSKNACHEDVEATASIAAHWLKGYRGRSTMNDSKIEEACARAAHEVNRAYCLALGDVTQLPWEDAPEWQKTSAAKGVIGAIEGATPEQSHEGWLAEKREAGWKFGPVKDPDKKEHPCFVPYGALPAAQRAKDGLFVMTVCAVAKALGHSLTVVAG